MMNNTALTVTDTAKRIGMHPQALREWLKKPTCPIGTAFRQTDSTHYTYVIYPTRVDELFGTDIQQKGDSV